MKHIARYLLPALGIWLLFSWPLPRYAASGIPASGHKTEKHNVRTMIPGDHLQLLYHFWIASDMMAGRTPPFHNLYEFNTGDDSAQREGSSYFMPFPLVYAVGAAVAGRAFGWNLAAFASLYLTYVLTVVLVRRYVKDGLIAGVAALVSITLPYLWLTLMGGSPTGLAMVWVPMLLLGIDLAVRDQNAWGGFAAGAALLLSIMSDTHVVFFGVLAAPCWCLVAFIARDRFEWRRPREYLAIALALAPAALFAGGVLFFVRWVKQGLADSHAAEGRDMAEVINFAPGPEGLFGWAVTGRSAHIYVGLFIVAVLAVGWLLLLVRCCGKTRFNARMTAVLSLLLLGVFLIVLLAMGPRVRMGGTILGLFRTIIPPYAMIRQTAKIYCLLPAILSVAAGISLQALSDSLGGKAARVAVLGLFCLALLPDYGRRVSPTISLLEEEQLAYRAVAEDARANGEEPRVIVSALWPGDTHYTSVYQHYVSLYRIRMVNGYRPFVPADYMENVFNRFESLNMGELTPDQLDALLEMGIRYVILHEDIFPERVGAYSIGFNLMNLLNNPRLEFMKQDGSVWSFKILEVPREMAEPAADWRLFSTARRWEAERQSVHGSARRADSDGRGRYVVLADEGAWLGTRLTRTVDAPDQRWLLRVRGEGLIECVTHVNDIGNEAVAMEISAREWIWRELPLPSLASYSRIWLEVSGKGGSVDLDMILLAAGAWPALEKGQETIIDAAGLFHAGYTDLDRGEVVFRPRFDTEAIVLYGPKLPMEKGAYEVELTFSSPAQPGKLLGKLNMQWDGAGETEWVPVVAGESAVLRFEQAENMPAFLAFLYHRTAEIGISGAVLRRLE